MNTDSMTSLHDCHTPAAQSLHITWVRPRMHTLRLMGSLSKAASMSSSLSNTLAGPLNWSPSLPVIFPTQPSGAKFPYNIWRWPLLLIGFSRGTMTFCPSLSPGRAAKFSARVLPAGRFSTQSTACVWADHPRALTFHGVLSSCT